MSHCDSARGADSSPLSSNHVRRPASVPRGTRTRGRFFCALTLASMLIATPVLISSSEAGSSQNSLPSEVQKAFVFLSLYRDNRHVALIFRCLRAEYPELGALSRSHTVLSTLKLKHVRSNIQRPGSDDFSATIKGRTYSISRRVGNRLVLQLTRFLIQHPKFEILFDNYVDKLKFAERLAIRAMLIAKSRTSLLSDDGRKFILEKIKKRTGRSTP